MSIEMEQAVIGCIFQDTNMEYIKFDEIKDDYFYDLQPIFKKVKEYRIAGKPAELSLAKEIMGADIASTLAQFHGTISSYPIYLNQIRKSSVLHKISDKILRNGSLDKEDFEMGLEAYYDKPVNTTTFNMESDLLDWMDDLEKRVAGKVKWYDWGVDFLDRELGKLKMGKFFVIKAVRKMGKTTMAIKLFDSFIKRNMPVIFISTETGYYDIMDKLASLNTQINSFDIQQGKKTFDVKVVTQAVKDKMYAKPGTIIVCTQLTMDFVRKSIDESKAKIVIIDFLQMLQVLDIPDGMNRTQVLDEMAIALKGICLEKDISIIALSQVNMEGWAKGCKAFEEKADCIMALNPREKGIETPMTTQLILNVLNRNGRSGDIKILYYKQWGDFIEDDGTN